MKTLVGQWMDIFRAGAHHGGDATFSAADIQQIVDNFDPSQFEVPAVLGHPKHDDPAYGWFSELRRDGDKLQGKARQMVPQFEQAVLDGRFPNRSVKLTRDAVKGWVLKHVGFLGAQLPEVKGLTPISFAADDQNAVEIEFSEETHMPEPTQVDEKVFSEQMKKFFMKLFGADKPVEVKTFSEDEVKAIATDAAKAAAAEAIKPFETKFSERETALSTSESTQRANAAIARVKAKGSWVPAFEKMGMVNLFHELAKQTVTVEFGEGATKTEKSQLEVLTEFMESLPKIVPSGSVEIVKPAGRGSNKGVNAGAFGVDDGSVRLHEATVAFAEEKGVTYIEAQTAVLAKDPTLGRLGSATAGAV